MQPIEVVRAWTELARRGERGIEMWHPDAEIVNARGWVVEATYRGRAGVERWWDDIAEAFSDVRFVLEAIEPVADDRLLTRQRMVGTFRTSGIATDQRWYSVFTVRDGLIARAVGYLSEREAREAVGGAGEAG